MHLLQLLIKQFGRLLYIDLAKLLSLIHQSRIVTIAKAEIGVAQTLRYTWSAQAAARLELDRVFPQFVSGTHVENMVLDTDVIGSVAQA